MKPTTVLKNTLNLPYDRFLVKFSNTGDFQHFTLLVDKVFKKTMKNNPSIFSFNFPNYISFSIIDSPSESATVIRPSEIGYYLNEEECVVHPTIFDMTNTNDLENLLIEIDKRIFSSEFQILGLD